MDTLFMNFKNSGTSDLHRLLLNLTDEINLNGSYKYVALLWLQYVALTWNE